MVSNIKKVTIPLLLSDMDTDLESHTIYQFDYDNSEHTNNCEEFLDYINKMGIISDVYFNNTPENIRTKLLEYYMTNIHFNHILSFNIAIMNCIYKLKQTLLRIKGSALSNEMEINFVNTHKDLLNKWIKFFDSYLLYMITFSTLKDKSISIKSRYNSTQINNDKSLSPNIVSLFLDDFFYDYYKSGINEDNINYYTYYFDNKLYDNKTFDEIMLNDANYFIKILISSAQDKKWENYLQKHF